MNAAPPVFAFLAVALCAPLAAQDSVRLVPENPDPAAHTSRREGWVNTETFEMSSGELEMNLTPPGAPEAMAGILIMQSNETVTTTSLGGQDFSRQSEGSETRSVTIGGQTMPEENHELPLSGIELFIDFEDGAYTIEPSGEGLALDPESTAKLEELLEDYNEDVDENPWASDLAIYGDGEHTVGETWELDAEAIAELMGDDDSLEAEIENGTITLRSVEEIDGVPHAILDIAATFTGVQAQPEESGNEGSTSMTLELEVTVTRNLEEFYDSEVDIAISGTMDMEMTTEDGVQIESSGPITMSGTETVAPAAAAAAAETE